MEKSFLISELLKEFSEEQVIEWVDEQSFEVLSLATQELTQRTCVFLDTAKYAMELPENIAMVMTTSELKDTLMGRSFGLCILDNPRNTFFELHNYLSKTGRLKRETFETVIAEGSRIHPLSSIAKNNVRIGKNVTIEEFVVIRENTTIGDHCIIRSGAVIGGVGFEFKRSSDAITAVSHDGGVIIGDYVEIQYHTCVDRAIYVWDNTQIDDYSKIDNLVHVGHGVKIGKRVLSTAGVIYGGRDVVGDDVWVGINATTRNAITIGEGARINMGAVVTQDVPAHASVSGNFAIDHAEFIARLRREKKKE